jgi:dTDP-4-amino-4,6-dideoxygalactose transaminase
LRNDLQAREIGTDVHYPHLDCDQPAWRQHGRSVGSLSVSRNAVSRILSLPCFPELSEGECDAVIDAIRHGA